ncbi:CAP domain-containing protein [Mastigocoleus sp. MO_188.B34]|uniref:CAP domain-containing protein n=1 Tax=Mastigocoleus sp. MO_188.B34 TaxID=3036635 RepID=UPI00262DE5AC|nr:CAP domain-containing protein [Mastigocoleus sp. MO_188.B34]MDJ0696112.1 CAP domain-containing protein [Mastigocoleus sp. MO_188.B34]
MPVNIFDASFYRSANPNLESLSDSDLWSHFQNHGLEAGLSFSPLVNLDFYRASNSDLSHLSNKDTFEHLQNYGISEGRQFSELWDLNFYRQNNNDLTFFSNEQLFQHLQNYGVAEGRRFSQFFDVNYYLADNPDLLTEFGNDKSALLQHFVISGLDEGRRFSVAFDPNFYRHNNPELANADLTNQQLLEHFRMYGLSEGRASSESFDVQPYLTFNSDFRRDNLNYQTAYEHFITDGLTEGRMASNYISEDAAGNTIESSRHIFLSYNLVTWREAVSNNDRKDIYKFTLEETSNEFNLTLNGLKHNAGVNLLNASGEIVAGMNNPGTMEESLIINNLDAGTFYIEVYLEPEGDSTHYNLSLSATPNRSELTPLETPIPQTPIPTGGNDEFIQEVLKLTNQERTKFGLEPLLLGTKLSQISQNHSLDMATNDFFSHKSPNGSSAVERAEAQDYLYPYIGENIAAGYSTPEAVVAAWMNSPGHRRNILNPYYKEIGIGYYHLENDTGHVNYTDYWTQNFSTQLTS